MNIEELENKYIDLLVSRCINFNKSKSLLISYNKINEDIIKKIVDKVKSFGINDIYLDMEDTNITREILLNSSKEEIKNNSYFDKSIWDLYAKKNSAFLIAVSYIPDSMSGIDEEKITAMSKKKNETRKLYRRMQNTYEVPWCIFALPNKEWANIIYRDNPDSYNLLYKTIFDICMVNEFDPVDNWNKYINENRKRVKTLNDLGIKKLHYKNSLGTDLHIELNPDTLWCGIGEKENNMLVNMPSYEVFTSPNYLSTNGVVYSSKPLIFNGAKIEDFYLVFKDGKVSEVHAKEGEKVLEGITNIDNYASYLGEIALVNYNSPISNTNKVFYETLFDENASCHLALGAGFTSSIPNGNDLSEEELLSRGVNVSKTHVDFMIGTNDLFIEAETKNGNVVIFKDGNFVI